MREMVSKREDKDIFKRKFGDQLTKIDDIENKWNLYKTTVPVFDQQLSDPDGKRRERSTSIDANKI
jgi:hypothetical protein